MASGVSSVVVTADEDVDACDGAEDVLCSVVFEAVSDAADFCVELL